MGEGVQQEDAGVPAVGSHERAAADPVRRDPRHVGVVVELRADEVVLRVEAGPAVAHRDQVELRADLGAVEGRVPLRIDDLLQRVVGAAGGEVVAAAGAGVALVDESGVAGDVARRVDAQRPLRPADAGLDGPRPLLLEVGIADLEGGGRVVCPARIQLEGGRRPLDIGPVQARDETVGQVLQRAEADALRGELAPAAVGERILARHGQVVPGESRRRAGGAVALDPPGALEAQAVPDVQFLEQVDGVRPGIGRRQQGARLARRPDLAPPGLDAERTGERAEGGEDRHVLHLHAALGFAVLEGGLDPVDPVLAEADLLVLVDRAPGPEPDRLEGAVQRPDLAAGQHPVLVRVQARAARRGLAAGDLVERVVVAVRDPDEAAVADHRHPDRAALRAVGGVGLDAGGRVVAVGAGPEAVGMDRDVLRTRVHRPGDEAAVVDAGIAGGDLAGIAARRDEGRHAVVLGRDHAADRLAAVAQRRRPADHLDPVGDQRVDRHAVVLAEFRDVLDADAVLLDPDPAVVEAADDRAAGRAGRVGRGRDAGPVHQRVAEGARLLAGDLLARHHRHRREGVDGHGQDPGRQARIGRRLRSGLDRARRGDAEFGQGDRVLRARRRRCQGEAEQGRPGECGPEFRPPDTHRASLGHVIMFHLANVT